MSALDELFGIKYQFSKVGKFGSLVDQKGYSKIKNFGITEQAKTIISFSRR